jgi:hypothetical protein
MTATLTRPVRNDSDSQSLITSLNTLTGKEAERFPDIITFAVHPRYLNRPNLYPRQATLLKIIFLGVDPYGNNIFTDYDYRVMNEWMSMFAEEGDHGIVTDLEQRMEMNRAAGRHWFREVVAVMGRRAARVTSGRSLVRTSWRGTCVGPTRRSSTASTDPRRWRHSSSRARRARRATTNGVTS